MKKSKRKKNSTETKIEIQCPKLTTIGFVCRRVKHLSNIDTFNLINKISAFFCVAKLKLEINENCEFLNEVKIDKFLTEKCAWKFIKQWKRI